MDKVGDRWCEWSSGRRADDRRADPTGSDREHQLGSGQPSLQTAAQSSHRRVGTVPVPFGRHAPRCEPERSGGDDERSIRTSKRLAECLDGAAIRVGGALEVPRESDVVLEREVDHAVGRGSCIPQAVEVIERAEMHLCPGGSEGSGRGIRAGEPDDLMVRADELGNDGGTVQPDAPVTNTRMRRTSSWSTVLGTRGQIDVSCCHHSTKDVSCCHQIL